MRIKEVEKATGLTAKAIRMYESKGLLTVARESENDYRDYSEEDVKRLKTIAVLRRLDIPVKEIKQWCDGEISLEELLDQAAKKNEAASRECSLRLELARDLAEIVKDNPKADISEIVEAVEELNVLFHELEDVMDEESGHLIAPLWPTIMALGPVGGTVLDILDGQTEKALLSFALSLIVVPLATWAWISYLKIPRQKRKSTGCLGMILLAVAVLALMVAIFMGIADLQNAMYLKEAGDIILVRDPWYMMPIFFEIELLILGMAFVTKSWESIKLRPKWLALIGAVLLAVNVVALHGCLTGVSVANENGIIRYSFFDQEGEMIPYSQIELVETGFKGKKLGLATGKTGDFYYRLHFADGTVEDWTEALDPEEDITWSWTRRLDGWIMDAGAEKESSDEFAEYCYFEPEIVEILLEVVRNR